MKGILICLNLLLSVTLFSQEKRLALVIGNSEYEHGGMLKTPAGDAFLMAFTLEDLGFKVISVIDATCREMEDAVDNFRKQLTDYDVTLFYFAGYGVQAENANYLLPVDAKLKRASDVKKESFGVNSILESIEHTSKRINMIILDACRVIPFSSWEKEGEKGFAQMAAPAGSIIVFSASPGTVAPEGDGPNSLFTESLTRQIVIPQPIEEVISNTGLIVHHESTGRQDIYEMSNLTGSLSLAGEADVGISTPNGKGSIMLTSSIAGNLYLDGLEIASVAPNSVIPLNNIDPGSYTLKIGGEKTWEDDVLVLRNQVTNVTANADNERESPVIEKQSPVTGNNVYIDERDGNQYSWKDFGSQTWMTQNLSYEIPDGSYCYDDETSFCDLYGRLYTWEAAEQACPEGWHLPSDEEWMALEQFLGMKIGALKSMGLRGKEAGNILKDTTGFNVLPGGYNLSKKNSIEIGKSAVFWTSSEYSFMSAYYRKLEISKGGIHRYYSKKSMGCSVRCVED